MKSKTNSFYRLLAIITSTVLLACVCLACVGCATKYEGKLFYTTEYFSTYVELGIYDYFDKANTEKVQRVWETITDILGDISRCVDVQEQGSDIARYNALASGQRVQVSETTAQLIRIATQAYQITDGAYNPAVYTLCDLWGFTPRFTTYANESQYSARDVRQGYDLAQLDNYTTSTPSQEYIDAFITLCNFDNVLSGNSAEGYYLTKHCADVTVHGVTYSQKIDLGGIAKGYAVDLVRSLLADNNYYHGYFSCGNSSILALEKPMTDTYGNVTGLPYAVSLIAPRQFANSTDEFATIQAKNTVITSSGDYQKGKYRLINDVRYCHIIDPHTGQSINTTQGHGVASITLIGGNGALCDALSTALIVLGADSLTWLNQNATKYNLRYVMVFYAQDRCEIVANFEQSQIEDVDGNYSFGYTLQEDKTIYNGSIMQDD